MATTAEPFAHALDHWGDIEARIRAANGNVVVFLDYDGTLTPIVSQPENARLSSEMRDILQQVSTHFPTVIITGRSVEVARAFVQLDLEQQKPPAPLYWAGSHGYDIRGTADVDGNVRSLLLVGEEHRAALRIFCDRLSRAFGLPPPLRPLVERTIDSEEAIREQLTPLFPGVTVEDNRFAIAVHYRNAAVDSHARVSAVVDAELARAPCDALTKHAGKMVWEVRPRVSWNKGAAVMWLLEHVFKSGALGIYMGDDVTDEDAFRVLNESTGGSQPRGIGIHVRAPKATFQTVAPFSINSVTEVAAILRRLLQADEVGSNSDHGHSAL